MHNQDNPYGNNYNNYDDDQQQPWDYGLPANSGYGAEQLEASVPPPPPYLPPSNPYESANYAGSALPYTTDPAYSGTPMLTPAFSSPRPRRRSRLGCVLSLLVVLLLIGGFIAGGVYAFRAIQKGTGAIQLPAGVGGVVSGITTVMVAGETTIAIDRNVGPIHVRAGADSHTISIKALDSSEHVVNQSIPYTLSSDHTVLTFDVSGFEIDDLQITVPAAIDLKLTTNDGEINVAGLSGHMKLSSNGGSIHVSQSTIAGPSSLDTNAGGVQVTGVKMRGSATFSTNGDGITFTGSLDPLGTYKFDTTTGHIAITVPGDSRFHIDATSSTSTVNSAFPGVSVQRNTIGAEAHGDVGRPPRAKVTVTDSTGSIDLQKGP
ncbi:MAG: DUF4097 family beta strand repeat protein [Ktedonobacteraceae bacterium]|nr:DUF4097 family beta strand repeat protein [Ktedonobacteraceae bacterium]